MKISTRLAIRKMKGNGRQLISMGILIAIASLFFTTLFSFTDSYQKQASAYFENNHYADVTLAGNFTNDDISALADIEDINSVEGRWVQEYTEADFSAKLQSVTTEVNIPYILKGNLPTKKNEVAVLNQYYVANDIKIGDEIVVAGNQLKIVGVVNSPEYIYYVKDSRTIFTDAKKFLVGYVSKDYSMNYNQIIYTENLPISKKTIGNKISFEQYTKQESQINFQMYDGDLDQFASFAYIFPVVFWIISFCVIFIILKRTVMMEHKYIGIMQALGRNKRTITRIYISQFVLLGFTSSLLGCLLSIPVSDIIIFAFKSMIELPNLSVDFHPQYWLFSIVLSVLGCLIFGLISMRNILNDFPHNSMRATLPKMKKSAKSKRGFQLKKILSFNSRYSLTTTIRNKGRFLVMIIGLSASTALLIFSLGFNDSLSEVTPSYFNTFASYDAIVQCEPRPLTDNILKTIDSIEQQDKALLMTATVQDEEYPLVILENDVHSLKLSNASLSEGIVIPEYYADLWNVKVGDNVKVNDITVKVSDIIPLGMGLNIFTSYDYVHEHFKNVPSVYNSVYVQANNLDNLTKQLNKQNMIFSTANEDADSFNTMLNSFQIIIMLLVACGIILGLAVIISMNIMNLSSREFEYMFMNIMGYSKNKILLSIFKETIIQLVLSIPIGLVLGFQLLNLIKGEFSQITFALYSHISTATYIIVIILVTLMSFIKLFSSNKFLNNLDIVEGLKTQDD